MNIEELNMRYDTAGNKIYDLISNCDCGLTGGCERCNLLLMKHLHKQDEERNKTNKRVL